MIEVNLLPGATRRPTRRRPVLRLPDIRGGLGRVDATLTAAVAAWIVAPALVGFMFFSARHEQAELVLDLDQAAQDSAHYATVIKANERLRARRDTIARKLRLIQDIDADRYIWSHIMDEVSRAVPQYTWLVTIAEVSDTAGGRPRFQVEGRTGNTFALTEFMKDLEASPFIADVRLITTAMVQEDNRAMHSFTIQAQYESPPADAIQTVPLFKSEE